jgi:transcriptional regulator with XRE-family HTH domain
MTANESAVWYDQPATSGGAEVSPAAQAPDRHDEAFRIRARMIGVLLRDARVSALRSQEDCARMLHTTVEEIEAWETGEYSPSMPQIELLAYYLDVPVSHFWGMRTLQGSERDVAGAQTDYLSLRDRMIGALLRHAMQEAGMSVDDLAAASHIDAGTIIVYQYGDLAIPVHELTVLADAVGKNLTYFLEQSSYIGRLLNMREKWHHFAELPDDLREFAANPLNIGFIEVAAMLAQMPADKLRRLGRSVLDITM